MRLYQGPVAPLGAEPNSDLRFDRRLPSGSTSSNRSVSRFFT